MRFVAMPRRTPRFGSLFCLKNSFSASARSSGSRSSPFETMPASSGPRASWSTSAWPLFETVAAASCEAPIFSPTRRFGCLPPRPARGAGRGIENERLLRLSFFAFGSASSSSNSGALFGLRPNESSRL